MKPEHTPHLINIAFGGLMRTSVPDDVVDHMQTTGYVKAVTGGLIPTQQAYDYLMKNGHKPSDPQRG